MEKDREAKGKESIQLDDGVPHAEYAGTKENAAVGHPGTATPPPAESSRSDTALSQEPLVNGRSTKVCVCMRACVCACVCVERNFNKCCNVKMLARVRHQLLSKPQREMVPNQNLGFAAKLYAGILGDKLCMSRFVLATSVAVNQWGLCDG